MDCHQMLSSPHLFLAVSNRRAAPELRAILLIGFLVQLGHKSSKGFTSDQTICVNLRAAQRTRSRLVSSLTIAESILYSSPSCEKTTAHCPRRFPGIR